ncbi:EamA family transporter [Kitasatospora sp. NPDC088346]|uniref:EamA family transporter n=1 Tax=Kitasatospora sp. NPDC088346 TaxID=3364073 RepID=UPI00381438FC
MTPEAVPLAVLAAALLHALWNAMAHRAGDRLAGFALMSTATFGCGLAVTCVVPAPDPAAWPFLAASCALQVGYQLLLIQAYRLGDFGQMYPIARGTSPLVVALLSVTVLGRTLPAVQAAGVLVVSLGLAGLAFAGGLPGRDQLPALAAALGTGVLIAGCTVMDGTGVRRADGTAGYLAWMFLGQGAAMVLVALAVRGRPLLTAMRHRPWPGLIGGVMSLAAYGLVVWAQTVGDLAAIAALRETSILIAALIGALVLREPLGRSRMAAGAAVVAGIVLLRLGHG